LGLAILFIMLTANLHKGTHNASSTKTQKEPYIQNMAEKSLISLAKHALEAGARSSTEEVALATSKASFKPF
jgi:hypothetical protein